MQLNFPSNKPSQPSPIGAHPGRLVRIIDLGTQTSNYQENVIIARKLSLAWELYTDPRMEDGRPFMVSERYTRSLNAKASLYKLLSTWLGQEFQDAIKSGGYNFTKLLGRPCLVTVNHQQGKTGNTFAKVASVSPLPKGLKADDQVNPSLLFDLDEKPYNKEVLDQLPRWTQEEIGKSPEFQATLSHPGDEEIPF